MKVAFQSAVIDDNQTGLGTYAKNLLTSFSEMKKMDQICTIHYSTQDKKFFVGKREVIVPHYPFYLSKFFGIPTAISKCKPDLIHFPVHRCDDFLSYFLNSNVKKILTIHDLIPLFRTDQRDFQTKYLWIPMLKYAHKKNVCIITVSNHTRIDCTKYLHISKEKIRVIPLSASSAFRPCDDKEILKIRIASRFGINAPFIFYTGSLLPRKNVLRLVKAFFKIKSKNLPHLLVISGSGKPYPSDLMAIIKKSRWQRDIIFIDYLCQSDLVDMYNAADVFVYPSLYEGFGLPVLEAMACGTPVVTSNTSSIPEVLGEAGIMINPYNIDELASALEDLLTDDNLKVELSIKGIARAKLFSWARTAKETWNIYEEMNKR